MRQNGRMKLVTWNTRWCRGLDGSVNPARIVAGARAMADFDVLCLQEIAQGCPDLPGQPRDQPAQLQALLPGFQLFFGAAIDQLGSGGTRQRFGNLVATRLPALQVQHHPLPRPIDAGVHGMPRQCSAVTVRDQGMGAVRVMTTHLESCSALQRMAQAKAVRALHVQACGHAVAPALQDDTRSTFQTEVHTLHAILCGDFNLGPDDPAYTAILEPFWPAEPMDSAGTAINSIAKSGAQRLHDAWPLVHGSAPRTPTFHLFERGHGREPVSGDFVFVSDAIAPRVRRVQVDCATQASDHQPVLLELD